MRDSRTTSRVVRCPVTVLGSDLAVDELSPIAPTSPYASGKAMVAPIWELAFLNGHGPRVAPPPAQAGGLVSKQSY